MAGLNKVMVIGNVGQDPDIRYAPSGAAVTTFSLAVNSSWTDRESGEKRENTEWINFTAFGKRAEVIAEHVRKGSQLYVEGRMKTDKVEKEDETRYYTKVVVDNFKFLGSRTSEEKQERPRQPEPKQESLDDDIPF